MRVYYVHASVSRLFASNSPIANRHLHEVSLKFALLFLGLFASVSKSFASDTTADDGLKETLTIHGKVLDASKKPVAGVTVDLRSPLSDFGGANAKTAADGSFSISFRALAELNTYGVRLEAKSNDSDQMGVTRLKGPSIKQACEAEQLIELVPTKTIKLKVTDAKKHPIKGARCLVECNVWLGYFAESNDEGSATFRLPENERIASVAAWMNDKGFDFRRYALSRDRLADANAKPPEFPMTGEETLVLDGVTPLTIRVVDDQGQPIPGVEVAPWYIHKASEPDEFNLSLMRRELMEISGADGTAVFRRIPTWQKSPITFWLTADGFVHTRANYRPDSDMGMLEVVVERLVPIRGRVTHADGSPAPSIKVIAAGGGYGIDHARVGTITDKNGNYELKVPPEQIYLVIVDDEKWGAGPQDGFAVRRGQPVEAKDFILRPATKVRGQLIDATTKKPIAEQTVAIFQNGQKLADLPGVELEHPKSDKYVPSYPVMARWRTTDVNGHFEFNVGNGSFELLVQDGNRDNKREKFDITSDSPREFTLTSKRTPKAKLNGLIVAGDPPQPVAGAVVRGVPHSMSLSNWDAMTTAEGRFQVEIPVSASVIQVISHELKEGALINRDADQLDITIPLKPLGSVHGRVIEEETGQPLANKAIEYGIKVVHENNSFTTRFGAKLTTGSDGTFHIEGLIQDCGYQLTYPTDFDSFGQPHSWRRLREFTLTDSAITDLGDVKLKPAPKPYVPPTFDERVAAAFGVPRTPLERFTKAKETAKLVDQRLVLLFGDPGDPFVRDLMKVRFEDESYAAIGSDFLVAAIPTDSKRLPVAKELAAAIQQSLDTDHGKCLLVVFDSAGTKLKAVDGHAFSVEGAFSKDKFIAELKGLAPTPRDGQKLLDEALAKAKAENKRVVVQETATWCGPCHRLSRYVDAHRIWEKDYIWVRMDQRWAGAKEIMEKLRDGDDGGIPWVAIMDSDGKVLASSKPSKETAPSGVNETLWHFEQMIKSTSQRLTRDEIVAWIKGLGESEK